VRLIAATKKNLAALVAEGRFREDLFYRLNVVSIDLPPLRERRVDVPLLIGEFLKRCDSTGRSVPPTTMAALSAYDWPGNVRELENAVRRAVALSPAGAQLAPEAFNPAFSAGAAPETGKAGILAEIPFKTLDEVIRDAEKAHIETALAAAGGNRTRTAEILGISRKTLWEKMLKHNISPEGAVERSGL